MVPSGTREIKLLEFDHDLIENFIVRKRPYDFCTESGISVCRNHGRALNLILILLISFNYYTQLESGYL